MSHHEKVAVETRKQMLQHQQNNSETSQITSCNITTSRFILQHQHETFWTLLLNVQNI
jgi:hypothetical protein